MSTDDVDLTILHASCRPGYGLRYHGNSRGRVGKRVMGAVPPPYLCFDVPKWQALNALESVMGLVWVNVFWVGLWDLLDNTLFPGESAPAMFLLMFLGAAMLYFTNSLYEPPNQKLPQPTRTRSSPGSPGPGDTTPLSLLRTYAHPALATDPALDIQDMPFVPPRFEWRRLTERILANIAAVTIWVGVWDQIDHNVLPVKCSYRTCQCSAYGEFPCAWYKIFFVALGLVGMYCTRQLYQDHEVTYVERKQLFCSTCAGKQSEA